MTNFWIAAAALILIALTLVLVPLIRGKENRTVLVSLIGLAVGLPALSLVLYQTLSTQQWDAPAQATSPTGAPPTPEAPQIEAMVAQLEERLKTGSGSIEEWLMLGRSYVTMQRFPEAVTAYRQAWNLSENQSVEAALGLGEAMTYVNRDALRGEAGDLVEFALEQNPAEPRALWFGGLVALARDNEQLASDRWTLLLNYEMPDQLRGVIQQQLAVLPPPSDGIAAPDAAPPVVIDVNISVSDSLKPQAANGKVVYVYVREPNKPGAPLAVARVSPVLPVSLRLSDQNVMIPGSTLAGKPALEVSARISMSGDPIAASGDLQGKAAWLPDTGTVRLVIDQPVP